MRDDDPCQNDAARRPPASLRAAMLERGAIVRATRGRVIVANGDASHEVYLMLAGLARVSLFSSRGREVAVHLLGPDDVFGEISALDGAPRSAEVTALAPCELIRIARGDFIACLEGSPEAGLWLARRLADGMRRLTQRVFELSALNVQARVQAELYRLAIQAGTAGSAPVVEPAPSHAELADRIGTHREAVTRELNALSALRVIRHGRRALQILDLPRLKAMIDKAA